MGNKNPSPSTRWVKGGPSPNPKGRTPGVRNKLSMEKMSEELSKRTLEAIKTVHKLMQENDNPNIKLKAALALLVEDKKTRELILKEVQEKLKIEQQKVDLELSQQKLEKLKNETSDKPEEKEDDNTPVLSLKAITGGKE